MYTFRHGLECIMQV